MTPKNSLFETPRRGQIDLNAQEVFLLSDADAELRQRAKERTVRAAATFALFLTTFSVSQTVYKDSDALFNLFKLDGPYDSTEYTDVIRLEETITPALPADDALYLADTFDGLLGSSGYNLVFDTGMLESSLEENQAAVITLEQMRPRDDSYIRSGTLVTGSHDPTLGSKEAYKELGIQLPDKSARIGDGIQWGDTLTTAESGIDYVTQDGIAIEKVGPAIATVTIVESDDTKLSIVSQESTTVEITANAECKDGDEFTTEAVLTPQQHEVICGMFESYRDLIIGDFAVHLDTIHYDIEAQDSVNYPSSSIRMTYPYVGDKEVLEVDVKRTFLHEVMHTTYKDAATDLVFFAQASFAFKGISANTVYKMPPHSEVNTFPATPAHVEPIWAIITESHYIGGESRHGHPWDNATEMISSTASVLAYYPDEFIANYEALNPLQQLAIRNTVEVTKGLIERYDVNVSTVIPKWDVIAEKLRLN